MRFRSISGAVEWLAWSPHPDVVDEIARAYLQTRRIPVALGVALVVNGDPRMPSRIREFAAGRSAAAVRFNPAVISDDRVAEALTRAMIEAGFGIDAASGPLAEAHAIVDAFLASPEIDVAFQPQVSLITGRVVGHEVLARPSIPIAQLVRAGVIANRTADVDHAILPQLLERIARHPGMLASLNLLPASLLDSRFSRDELVRACHEAGVEPESLTIECTEQQVVSDLDQLTERVADLRRAGFSFAVDDAGAGHASIALIARLRPSSIKIDRTFVSNVHRNGAHRAVIEAFRSFSRRIGARLVAEGVETDAELHELISLGIDIGQGYLLGRPAAQPLATADAPAVFRPRSIRTLGPINGDRRIGDLVERAATVEIGVNGDTVRRRFVDDLDLTSIVIVDGAGRPTASLARDRVMRRFSGQFGHALFARRPAVDMADTTLRTVRNDVPFVDIAMATTARDHASLHDDIIVVDANGYLVGVVAVRELMRALTDLAVDLARDVNPLTGLPGNRRIREVLSKAVVVGEPVVITYLDLDSFKAYNDRVGFAAGDDVIQHFGEALLDAGTRHGAIFVGHVGGDDFVAVWSTADECRAGVARISDTFRSMVGGPPGPACSGGHLGDAELSLSAASVEIRPGLETEALTMMLAELKRDVKGHGGGRHVIVDAEARLVDLLSGRAIRIERPELLTRAG